MIILKLSVIVLVFMIAGTVLLLWIIDKDDDK